MLSGTATGVGAGAATQLRTLRLFKEGITEQLYRVLQQQQPSQPKTAAAAAAGGGGTGGGTGAKGGGGVGGVVGGLSVGNIVCHLEHPKISSHGHLSFLPRKIDPSSSPHTIAEKVSLPSPSPIHPPPVSHPLSHTPHSAYPRPVSPEHERGGQLPQPLAEPCQLRERSAV